MRTFGRFLGRVLITIIVACGLAYLVGPYERVSVTPTVVDADVGADVDAYFATQEARFQDLTPGVEKRVIWAEDAGARTELAIVYVHGFSATSEEIRPVPDRVAAVLGANLVYTRLQGHGRDGAALDGATVQGWANDFAEAMIVARRVADEVVVISTSTGGGLVAAMADQPEVMDSVKGLIFVSPNFQINNPAATLLTWPGARYWGPLVAGRTQSFEPSNAAHGTYWTTTYPTTATLQMAALTKMAFAKAYSDVMLPALFWISDEDRVVKPEATKDVAARWGGPALVSVQQLGPGQDPYAHVIAGDILSPGETDKVVDAFVKFIKGL